MPADHRGEGGRLRPWSVARKPRASCWVLSSTHGVPVCFHSLPIRNAAPDRSPDRAGLGGTCESEASLILLVGPPTGTFRFVLHEFHLQRRSALSRSQPWAGPQWATVSARCLWTAAIVTSKRLADVAATRRIAQQAEAIDRPLGRRGSRLPVGPSPPSASASNAFASGAAVGPTAAAAAGGVCRSTTAHAGAQPPDRVFARGRVRRAEPASAQHRAVAQHAQHVRRRERRVRALGEAQPPHNLRAI